MNEFNQRTGILAFKSGDFRFAYENDGAPPFVFDLSKERRFRIFADGGDGFRTAAAAIGYKDFVVKTNLFAGERNRKDESQKFADCNELVDENKGKIKNKTLTQYDIDKIIEDKRDLMQGRAVTIPEAPSLKEVYKKGIRSLTSLEGQYGEKYTNILTLEKGSIYRHSTLTLGYGGIEAGIESEKVRHLFQNRLAHDKIGLQPQWEMLSNEVLPYAAVTPFKFKYRKENYFGWDNSFTLW